MCPTEARATERSSDLVDIAYYSVRTPIDYSFFTQTESITVVVFSCYSLFLNVSKAIEATTVTEKTLKRGIFA